jgi:hypothetical protein
MKTLNLLEIDFDIIKRLTKMKENVLWKVNNSIGPIPISLSKM